MDFELKSLRSSLHSFIHPWIHSLTMHLPPNYVKHCTRWGITGEGSRGGKHKSEWLVSSRIEKPTFYWGRWAGARILCSREVLWEAHASSKEGMATHISWGGKQWVVGGSQKMAQQMGFWRVTKSSPDREKWEKHFRQRRLPTERQRGLTIP